MTQPEYLYLWYDDEYGDDQGDGDVHPEEPSQEDEVGGHHGAEMGLDVLDPLLPGGDLGHTLLDQFPGELKRTRISKAFINHDCEDMLNTIN